MTAETSPRQRAPGRPISRRISRPRTRDRIVTWADRYRQRLIVTDAIVVVVAVVAAEVARFGTELTIPVARLEIPAVFVAALIAGFWVVLLHVTRVSDVRIIGTGPTEFSRLVSASLTLFGLLAIVDLLLKLNIARGFIALALPLGTLGLLLSHLLWRLHLKAMRRRRRCLNHVLVIGGERSARPLIAHLTRSPELGYEVVGVCLPSTGGRTELTIGSRSVPILGDFSDAGDAVVSSRATTVAVTSAEVLGHSAMRELSWELEGLHVDMVVDPGVIDVAGPRMLVRPVAGLPLLHVDKPAYRGANRIMKAVVDRLGALAALTLAAPVLLACAIAIKLDSPGPVFYRAPRIGLNNEPFLMWKFRSMVVDADKRLADLKAANEGAGLLFKMRDDPRVTRIGKKLRRYSLDELPQLFNVLGGSMSLVGPRPPLPSEVLQYTGPVTRRMLVRPGITGLWQVSGRSDLNWEESVRLDLSYVENWSIAQDIAILWRTVRTVVSSRGAY
ncbi:sugar transferase [Williamsia deligens]|uniref:Sugar transferase n=1 Tax=Williamsia deligens TaxID=321325 RepID=A0ABW3G753_9NOCA|nr:sugar transferase [Williamsia deligens]MCP2194539.1 Undecaprenyl-phosphate galactose phosphotransferase, WbaP/exopolysaccharide biosynthesis polyprenyl glycosylphosphotransferase [Williamsia deligens]